MCNNTRTRTTTSTTTTTTIIIIIIIIIILENSELSRLVFESITKIVKRKSVGNKRMRWAGHVARMGKGRGVHRVFFWEA
jgi:hypothetical protein